MRRGDSGAGNSGVAAGQIGQSSGAKKRQWSGVGPVRKRGGGIEVGRQRSRAVRYTAVRSTVLSAAELSRAHVQLVFYEEDVGLGSLGRTGLSIRADSAFHLGKCPKTRFIGNFELRHVSEKPLARPARKLFLGSVWASPVGLGLPRIPNRHWCFSAPKTARDRAPEP